MSSDLVFLFANNGQVVHIGSKTRSIYTTKGDSADFSFSFELRHISLTKPDDVIFLRKNKVPWEYIDYHQSLIKGKIQIIEVEEDDSNRDLSLPELIVKSKESIRKAKNLIKNNAVLMVWDSTEIEQDVANRLGIPLWGSPKINFLFGHKSGARLLAKKCKLNIPPGKSCKTKAEVLEYLRIIKNKGINKAIIKYDESYGGIGHLIIDQNNWDISLIKKFLKVARQNLGGGWTVEQWIPSKKTIGGHIEIDLQKKPHLSYLWEQIIDNDSVSYKGAIPLNIEKKHLTQLMSYMKTIGKYIAVEGGQGSFGPDFMISKDEKIYFNELNARIPSTAFALHIAKLVKGYVPKGFLATSLRLPRTIAFYKLRDFLENNDLLYPNSKNEGLIPYHVGQLKWNNFYFVIITESQNYSQFYYKQSSDIIKKL